MTYRAVYVRDGRPRGVTFWAYGAESASAWAESWCSRIGAQLLTVAAVRPRLTLRG